MAATATEIVALREENASLKKELRKARATIKRLTSSGDAGSHAAGAGEGVATSASTGALLGNRSGLEEGEVNGKVVVAGRAGIEPDHEQGYRTPRESRSRKKINIDTARATDAVVEAVTGGGEIRPNLCGSESADPKGGLGGSTRPDADRPPDVDV